MSDRVLTAVLDRIERRNINPAEVEAAIQQHPDLLSPVVVGLPHEDLGQVAHVVVQVARLLTAVQLTKHLSQLLVRYKQPRSYRFVGHSLRDDAGVVRRPATREQELQVMAKT